MTKKKRDGHYWIECNGVSLGVDNLRPWRKSLALTLAHGNKGEVLAYFRKDECAKAFDEFIASFTLPRNEAND